MSNLGEIAESQRYTGESWLIISDVYFEIKHLSFYYPADEYLTYHRNPPPGHHLITLEELKWAIYELQNQGAIKVLTETISKYRWSPTDTYVIKVNQPRFNEFEKELKEDLMKGGNLLIDKGEEYNKGNSTEKGSKRMPILVNRISEVRISILRYLEEIISKAKNENMDYQTINQIQHSLKVLDYSSEEVTGELLYLVDERLVQKSKRKDLRVFNRLTRKYQSSEFTTIEYKISSLGRDFLHQNKSFGKIKKLEKEDLSLLKKFFINPKIVIGLKQKKSTFNYKKIIKLINELNSNYVNNNQYSCSLLIKAILNNLPPLFSMRTFEEVVNNYPWIKTDKNYMNSLLRFRDTSDDTAHRPISKHEDLIEMSDLPAPITINRLLQECLELTP